MLVLVFMVDLCVVTSLKFYNIDTQFFCGMHFKFRGCIQWCDSRLMFCICFRISIVIALRS